MQAPYGSMLAMDSSHPWVSNIGKNNMHPAMHGCVAITDDPNKYHITGFGTVLPHLPPGVSGGNSKAAGAMEAATGDGASPGFKIEAPPIVFIDPEDPVTGEGARGVINQSKVSSKDIEGVMTEETKLEEKMVKLAQISQDGSEPQADYAGCPVGPNGPIGPPGGPLGPQCLPGPSGPNDPNFTTLLNSASIQQFNPSRDYAFEQALRQPVQPPSHPYLLGQPGVPSALYAMLDQQAAMIKLLQDKAGLEEKKRSDFAPYDLKESKDKIPEKDSGDYGHIGLPWLKDPPEAPKVTVIFSFGRMTHKAKFHDVSVRQCGHHRCLYLAIDERFEGSMTFPDPSDEPFRVVVPEKELDLIVYDADIRLDCGGKLTFIVLLEAGEEYGG